MEFPIYTEQDYTEMEAWSRFIYKASRGSYKAVEVRAMAEATFVAEWLKRGTNEEWEKTTDEFENDLRQFLGLTSPFEHLNDFLRHLRQWNCLPTLIPMREEPFHPHEYYANLWSKSLKVDEVELTYDAAAYCINHWTWADYRLLSEIEDQAAYNSQDVAASMLFLITARQFPQKK